MILENIFNFLIFPEFSPGLWIVRGLFLSITILLVGFLVFFILKTRWFKLYIWHDFIEFFTMKIYGGVRVGRKWKKLRKRALRAEDHEYKKLIIKSHKLFGKLLKRLSPLYQSFDFGRQLARADKTTFSCPEDIWWAHELYKDIIRENTLEITEKEFRKSINAYNQAFIDLEVVKGA